jgi:hypothetical protein
MMAISADCARLEVLGELEPELLARVALQCQIVAFQPQETILQRGAGNDRVHCGVLFLAHPPATAEAKGDARDARGVEGDKVVTGGGILGTVQRVTVMQDKDGKPIAASEIEVEIAPKPARHGAA